jgi:two-component system sensor histidine kinase BarA
MTAQEFSVLIADDNELNRWLLCEQLRQWTTNIAAANDGQEALQLLQTQQYSLIFLDVNMPFLNGLDLIEKIRTEQTLNSLTPTIAVTAHTQSQQRQALIAAGFNDCLVKPVLLQHLKQIIQKWRILATNEAPKYYAEQIVRKTEFNQELSQLLLNKLFDEVPECLLNIADALKQPDYGQAWQIAHKLHGTFSFYGFADFLPMAETLEHHLLNREAAPANTQLLAIQEKFSGLLNNKSAILANVASTASQDFK